MFMWLLKVFWITLSLTFYGLHASSQDDLEISNASLPSKTLQESDVQYKGTQHAKICNPLIDSISYFFSRCRATLVTLDISACADLKMSEDNFLRDFVSLKQLVFHPALRINDVGDYFLSGCQSLEELPLNFLEGSTFLGKGFMSYCNRLKRMDLTPLRHVSFIGNLFFYGCFSLREVDMPCFEELTCLGSLFLAECINIRSIHLSFPKLRIMGSLILFHCVRLIHVKVTNMSELQHFQQGFLLSCLALAALDVTLLSETQQNMIIKALPAATFMAYVNNQRQLNQMPLQRTV